MRIAGYILTTLVALFLTFDTILKVLAFVSGPRNVMNVWPRRRLTANSKRHSATDRNVPPRSL